MVRLAMWQVSMTGCGKMARKKCVHAKSAYVRHDKMLAKGLGESAHNGCMSHCKHTSTLFYHKLRIFRHHKLPVIIRPYCFISLSRSLLLSDYLLYDNGDDLDYACFPSSLCINFMQQNLYLLT